MNKQRDILNSLMGKSVFKLGPLSPSKGRIVHTVIFSGFSPDFKRIFFTYKEALESNKLEEKKFQDYLKRREELADQIPNAKSYKIADLLKELYSIQSEFKNSTAMIEKILLPSHDFKKYIPLDVWLRLKVEGFDDEIEQNMIAFSTDYKIYK